MEEEKEKEETKEDFCGACAAIPIALIGSGIASQSGNHKKNKKIILCVGVFITLISLIIAVYFILQCKNCR